MHLVLKRLSWRFVCGLPPPPLARYNRPLQMQYNLRLFQ